MRKNGRNIRKILSIYKNESSIDKEEEFTNEESKVSIIKNIFLDN